MITNFSTATQAQTDALKLHILLDNNNNGKTIASVLEFPNLTVEASTQEQAIENLQKILQAHLEKREIVPIEIRLPESKAENIVRRFAGMFKDDSDFAEIADSLRA